MKEYEKTEKVPSPCVNGGKTPIPQWGKRVNIVSVKLIWESSMLYKNRRVLIPTDAWELFRVWIESTSWFLH